MGLNANVDQLRRSGRVMWSGSPPGEKHWHGAIPTTDMVHTAIQELDGKVADWMEHVSDAQCRMKSLGDWPLSAGSAPRADKPPCATQLRGFFREP